MPNQVDVISVLFFCKKSLLARHAFALFERTTSYLIFCLRPLDVLLTYWRLLSIFWLHCVVLPSVCVC